MWRGLRCVVRRGDSWWKLGKSLGFEGERFGWTKEGGGPAGQGRLVSKGAARWERAGETSIALVVSGS